MDISPRPRRIGALLLIVALVALPRPVLAQSSSDDGFCHALVDPTCDGYFTDDDENVFLCDPVGDAGCEATSLSLDDFFAIDDLFNDLVTGRPRAAVAAVLTRSDLRDDTPVEQLEFSSMAAVAAGRLLYAVDALAEVGAFAPDEDPELNTFLDEIRERVPSGGLADHSAELSRFADDFPFLIAQLEAAGIRLSPEIIFVEEALLDPSFETAATGDAAILEPIDWLVALADLVARQGATASNDTEEEKDGDTILAVVSFFETLTSTEPSSGAGAEPATETAAESTATSQPAAEPVDPIEGESSAPAVQSGGQSGSQSGNLGLLAALLGIVVAIAVIGAGLLRRRRGAPVAASKAVSEGAPPAPTPAPSRLSLHDLVDASRRMTASLDATEIAAIALDEAKRLVDADGGLVVRRVNGSMVVAHQEPTRFFDAEGINKGSLLRVTETGRSIVAVASEEPVLVEVPMAMAAVPIVTEGNVNGALLVVRVPSQPFDRNDLDALEMLAPLIGSSFKSASAHDTATELVHVEPLTGLKNRRCLDRDLAALDSACDATYVMVDVDHFKNFNDVNGHAAGDEALKRIARLLEESVRPGDVVYRYGGEEFCMLLRDASADDASLVAERARAAVASATIAGGENQPSGHVTISVGVADTVAGPVSDLVQRADAALYVAKRDGRNRVAIGS